MAKLKMVTTDDAAPPTGSFQLPDADSFAEPVAPPPNDPNSRPGCVVGLDLTAWAYATIDLTGRPDRIAGTRMRYIEKGYKKLGGEPIVVGVPLAEVWVKPRALWLAAKVARRQVIAASVRSGVLSESALAREVTVQG